MNTIESELKSCKKFISSHADGQITLGPDDWKAWLTFKRQGKFKGYLYLISFQGNMYAWGTASSGGQRIRRTSLFHNMVTGKYDRRFDYILAREIYGKPEITIYGMNSDPRKVESAWLKKNKIDEDDRQLACIRGVPGESRKDISDFLFSKFKKTAKYKKLDAEMKSKLNEFYSEFYVAKLTHPQNKKRPFHYGDCLEPGFLDRDLGRSDLRTMLEKVFEIKI